MVTDDRVQRIVGILGDSFFPILQEGLYFIIPLTLISFVLGTMLAFFTALARLSNIKALNAIAKFYVLIFSGDSIVGAAFHSFLRIPKHWGYVKSISGCSHRIYPECRKEYDLG